MSVQRIAGATFAWAILCSLALRTSAQDTWSLVSSSTTQNLWSVAWGGDTFVAAGENGAIVTSPDGITWTPRVSDSTRWLVGAGHGNGLFVIVGDAGALLTSPDGIAWTGRTSGTTARINGVAYGGGRWLAVAESGEVLSSTDGLTWNKLSPSSDRLRGITHAYGQFVITGDNGLMRVTVDTLDYVTRNLPEQLFVESVVYARRMFVAVGEDGYAVRSDDAVNWQRVATHTATYLRGVTFFNHQFIAAGSNGTILTTPDPSLAWTARAPATSALLTSVTANSAAAIAVGFNGTILRSAPAPAVPVIVAGPRNVDDTAGSNVLLSVIATGSPPLSYQWSFRGAPIAGQTGDRLLITNLQSSNTGDYTVTVRNPIAAATSGPATVAIVTSTTPGPIVDPTFSPTITFTGNVSAAVEEADGRLLVGGSQIFVTAGVSPIALVRLNVDGSFDPSLNIGAGFNAGAAVTALAVQSDGRILVAGAFTTFNGVPRANLLRLNRDGSLDLAFVPATAPMPNSRLDLAPDGKILVNGMRLNPDGSIDPGFLAAVSGTLVPINSGYLALSAGRIAWLRADGSLERSGTGPSGDVTGFWRQASGHILIGRNTGFSANVTRLNRDGTNDTSFASVARTISYFRNTMAGFQFAGTPAGGVTTSWEENLAVQVGGGVARTIQRYSADGLLDLSFNVGGGPNGALHGILPLRDGRTMLYGAFTTFDGITRPRLVRLVAANATPVQPPVIVSLSPEAAAVRPGEPVVITASVAGSAPLAYHWYSLATGNVTSGPTFIPPTALSGTYHVTLTASNRAGEVTSAPVRIVIAPSAPVIIAQPPSSISVRLGQTATLTVTPGGSAPFTYEWYRGNILVGVTPTLTLTNVSALHAGDYTVVIRNHLGLTTSQTVRLSIDGTPRLANISTRATVAPGEQVLIAGFVVGGTGRKDVLIRGAGPALSAFLLTGLLPDPIITLQDSAGRVVASNNNWSTATTPTSLFTSVSAFAFPNASNDAALRATLDPGAYTLHVTDTLNRGGLALAEIYDLDIHTGRIANLSSRAFVGAGANIAISGIVVQGQQPGRYLIRAAGPALARFGVNGALADPQLVLTTASAFIVGSNDNWSSNTNVAEINAATTSVAAFPLEPGSRDAALLLTLAPGNYTALVSGAGNTSGVALVEIYEVP